MTEALSQINPQNGAAEVEQHWIWNYNWNHVLWSDETKC